MGDGRESSGEGKAPAQDARWSMGDGRVNRAVFSIGTNFSRALLEGLRDLPEVIDLYGALPKTVVGHGRPHTSVPQVSRADIEAHVCAAHAAGRRFSYLLNAPSMGGRQFLPPDRRSILDHLDWISAIPVDSVTVSLPDLVEIVTLRYPSLKVKISHNCMVTTVEQALMFQEMGASMITVHGSVLRDFPLLERMASALSIPIQLICTANCVRGCPNRISYHSAATAVLSAERTGAGPHLRHATGYCFSWCHMQKLKDPRRVLMAGVRPEDVARYRDLGIWNFKLDTRVMRTDQILDRTRAYVSGRWDGDLKRMLSVFSLGYRTTTGTQMGGGMEGSDATDPAVENYFQAAQVVDMDAALEIDNRMLAGLMDRFGPAGCPSECDDCRKCDPLVSAAMDSDPLENARLLEILEAYRDWMFGR